jgi:hypothetical protein
MRDWPVLSSELMSSDQVRIQTVAGNYGFARHVILGDAFYSYTDWRPFMVDVRYSHVFDVCEL